MNYLTYLFLLFATTTSCEKMIKNPIKNINYVLYLVVSLQIYK